MVYRNVKYKTKVSLIEHVHMGSRYRSLTYRFEYKANRKTLPHEAVTGSI